MAESSSDDQFRVLQREIRDAIRRNHPNPGRVGCVGSEKLAAMARGSLPTDDPAYSHVMECSPCYEELMAATEQVEAQKAKSGRRSRFLPAVAASVLVLIGAAAVWFFTRQPIHPTSPAPSSPTGPIAQNRPPSPPPDLPVGVLNLENDSPTRGEGGTTVDRGIQRLARKRMNLVIYLPLGMDEGAYEVEVARPNGPALLRFEGTARIENGLTTLKVQPDFTDLAPGRYELRYRRPGGTWRESLFSLR